jgi:Flp pilus assembly protein TadG
MQRLTQHVPGRPDWRDDRGATAVVVALTMSIVLGMAALVIDVGATQARRAQLQEAADASALAIAQQCEAAAATSVSSCAASVIGASSATAQALAVANVNDRDVAVSTPVFTPSTVKVTATGSQVGFFSRLFGIDSTSLSASAKAQWTLPVTPLPLAYQDCALPSPSSTTVFLRSDILDLSLPSCGLLSGVTGTLGASWAADSNCSFDVNLLTYVGGVLSNVLPPQCASMVTTLVGRQVLLPVYDDVIGPIVINGVLLGNGYAVQKYALVTVTGYDFQSVNLLGISLGGPKSMPGNPQCPTVLGIELPLCQGIQGKLVAFLTPAEAAQRLAGVRLIE